MFSEDTGRGLAGVEEVMSEVNADVLAQMHRIHRAANDGTFDRDTINDALRRLHDFLTGAAYTEAAVPGDVADADTESAEEAEEAEGGEDDHPAKRSRKKK